MKNVPEPRISVPETAKKGDVIEIRTLINHIMHNGYNYDRDGQIIPRQIINTFFVTYNGVEIFRSNLQPGTAENPYVTFYTVATESGTLEFTWLDDDGDVYKGSRTITVT
jgi:sulfur-oxidizing protein SoxZ